MYYFEIGTLLLRSMFKMEISFVSYFFLLNTSKRLPFQKNVFGIHPEFLKYFLEYLSSYDNDGVYGLKCSLMHFYTLNLL